MNILIYQNEEDDNENKEITCSLATLILEYKMKAPPMVRATQ